MNTYTHTSVRQFDPFQIYHFTSVHSTNTLLMERLQAEAIPEFTVYLADQQTAGRGRQGKLWVSPKQAGVFMSIVVRPELPLAVISQLTLVTAVAVRRALAKLSDTSPVIKWPNDIFFGSRKVCGILTEMNVQETQGKSVIVGIGVNLNLLPTDFPPELQKISTSLLAVTGQEWDRDFVADTILQEFARCYRQFLQEQSFASFREDWEAYNYTIGKTVQITWNREQVSGVAKGIDHQGHLRVDLANGEVVHVNSGEVLVIG